MIEPATYSKVLVSGFLTGLSGEREEGQPFLYFHKNDCNPLKGLLLLSVLACPDEVNHDEMIAWTDDQNIPLPGGFSEVFVLVGGSMAQDVLNHWLCGDRIKIKGELIYSLPQPHSTYRWPVPLIKATAMKLVRELAPAISFVYASRLIASKAQKSLVRMERQVAQRNALVEQMDLFSEASEGASEGMNNEQVIDAATKHPVPVALSAKVAAIQKRRQDVRAKSDLLRQLQDLVLAWQSTLTGDPVQIDFEFLSQPSKWSDAQAIHQEIAHLKATSTPSLYFEMLITGRDVVPF